MSRQKPEKRKAQSTRVTTIDTTASRKKFSFRRSVLPPLVGVLVTVVVLAAFNSQLLIAQWKYRYADKPVAAPALETNPQAIAVDTRSPNPERGPYLTVPSINVEAPIIFESSFEEWKVQLALRSGVVHYGTTANPGDNGNVVILGHSSGQPWAPGNYKFVFTTKPTITLVTCTPVGTSTNRLIIQAEQISPASNASQSTPAVPVPAPEALPASAGTSLWERFLDLFR
jgi:sortase (surface protein transpeptidase)